MALGYFLVSEGHAVNFNQGDSRLALVLAWGRPLRLKRAGNCFCRHLRHFVNSTVRARRSHPTRSTSHEYRGILLLLEPRILYHLLRTVLAPCHLAPLYLDSCSEQSVRQFYKGAADRIPQQADTSVVPERVHTRGREECGRPALDRGEGVRGHPSVGSERGEHPGAMLPLAMAGYCCVALHGVDEGQRLDEDQGLLLRGGHLGL